MNKPPPLKKLKIYNYTTFASVIILANIIWAFKYIFAKSLNHQSKCLLATHKCVYHLGCR